MPKYQDRCSVDKKLAEEFNALLIKNRKDKKLMFDLFYRACINDLEEAEKQLDILSNKKKKS